MRVLLTAQVIRSGVLTHVGDLGNYLGRFKVDPCLALMQGAKEREAAGLHHTRCPYFFYRKTKELMVLAQNHQVSRIHAHSPLTFQSSLEAAKNLSIPLIITLHGMIDWAARYPEALAYAAQIIAVGPGTAHSAGPAFQNKIRVIYNGIDLERFQPAGCAEPGSGPLRVLYFGRTKGSDARGLMALDRAVGLMRKQGNPVDAHMVGRAAGVYAGNFHQWGWLDDPLPVLQKGHVVFGRGRSLREAVACGNVGFLLGEGYGGCLTRRRMNHDRPSFSSSLQMGAKEADPGTIAGDLTKLAKCRYLLQSLKKEAQSIAFEHFDALEMARETAWVYRKE